MRFYCPKCNNDKWIVDYETEVKEHQLTCIKCGYKEALEYVLSGRRNKNVRQSRQSKSITKPSVTNRQPDTHPTERTTEEVGNNEGVIGEVTADNFRS